MTQSQSMQRSARSGFELNGRHVFAMLAVFFGVMIGSNMIFLYYAVTTFTGVETTDAYRKGLAYNERIAEDRTNTTQSWKASMTAAAGSLRIDISDADGRPVTGLALDGRIGRPSTDRFDAAFKLREVVRGSYEAAGVISSPGRWIVTVAGVPHGAAQNAPEFRMKERLWVEQ